MASGDRVVVHPRIPGALFLLLVWYQNDRNLPSFNSALVELLETHPAILTRYHALLYPKVTP